MNEGVEGPLDVMDAPVVPTAPAVESGRPHESADTLPFTPIDIADGSPLAQADGSPPSNEQLMAMMQQTATSEQDRKLLEVMAQLEAAQAGAGQSPQLPGGESPLASPIEGGTPSPRPTEAPKATAKEGPTRMDKIIKILKPLAIPILAFLAMFGAAREMNKNAAAAR